MELNQANFNNYPVKLTADANKDKDKRILFFVFEAMNVL